MSDGGGEILASSSARHKSEDSSSYSTLGTISSLRGVHRRAFDPGKSFQSSRKAGQLQREGESLKLAGRPSSLPPIPSIPFSRKTLSQQPNGSKLLP